MCTIYLMKAVKILNNGTISRHPVSEDSMNEDNKVHLKRCSHSLANVIFFPPSFYLKGDIHGIRVDLRSVCVCLML